MSRTFLLQDWVTVRGNLSTAQAVTQDAQRWLDLDGFSDVTCWIDIAEVTPPGGSNANWLSLTLETSAVCDEAYFTSMTPPVLLGAGTSTQFYRASTTPIVTRSGQSLSSSNLMRYLRWKITPSTTGTWDMTFRVRAVASRSVAFVPPLISGCALWLRSDLGVSLSGSSITAWQDQSGAGNNAAAVVSPTYVAAGVNNLPKITVASGNYFTGNFASSVSNHTLFAVLQYPLPLGNYAAIAATNGPHDVNSGFAQFTESPTGIVGRAGASATSFTTASTSDTSSLGALGIYSSAASSSGAVDIWANGIQKASVSTALTLAACPSYLLFTLSVPTQYNFVGDAYEVIIYGSALSASDRLRVHRYLGARYGIAVP